MRLNELRSAKVEDLSSWCARPEFAGRLRRAQQIVHAWIEGSLRPVISCGGGKDSLATALLVRSVRSDVPILCAHPPNPLPGRTEHLERVRAFFGGPWIDIEYPWEVEAVLDGGLPYPEGLKIRRLMETMNLYKFDGLAMGLRQAESHLRALLAATKGDLYRRKDGVSVCLPVLRWRAEEVLGFAMSVGAPLNPVYACKHLMPSYDVLRDGTWWPHGAALRRGYRGWLAWHFPALIGQFDRAALIVNGGFR